MGDSNPVNQEVEQFNKQKLRKTETQEKQHFPTKEEIEEEKKANKEEK
ncbi:thymosin beta 1 [Trachinotus anak]